MTALRGDLYDALGETVSYVQGGSTFSTVSGILSARRERLTFRAADISTVTPARGDRVTDSDGRIYDYPGPETLETDGISMVVQAEYLAATAEWQIPLRLVP